MWKHPQSAVPGIVSPAIPRSRAATILSLLFQLEQSQYYPPAVLTALQCGQLKTLFRYAASRVPFYRDRFARAGVDPRGEVTLDVLRRLPILTRTEFQEAGDSIKTTALPPAHGKVSKVMTSGTTGRAVTLYKTELMARFWDAFVLRDVLWHKPDLSLNLAAIRWRDKSIAMAPEGMTGRSWGTAVGSVYATGPSALLNIASELNAQANWLLRQDPAYLLTYPSNLMALARHFVAKGYQLSRLRGVFTLSEVVTEELRRVCREVFGVKIMDSYTCEEAGYLALQCPEREHYHVQSENVLLEVVDDDGQACRPGESGRILITSLHNFAVPMIRYELGDYAELGQACPCGRSLPVLSRILGRKRNRLILPNGESQFPYLGEFEDYTAITGGGSKEFQFIQHSVDHVEMMMVRDDHLSKEQEEKLRALIVRNFGHPFRITLSYPEAIPRSGRGKFEEFVSKVDQ